MLNLKSTLVLCSSLFVFISSGHAETKNVTKHPFYVGGIGGYGATTWDGLVPTEKNQKAALMVSIPIEAEEGGATWGAFAGYEFSPNLAVEASYLRYPRATVYFDDFSLFSLYHDQSSFTSQTKSIGLMGKIMLPIADSNFRVFSGAGAAGIYREDLLVENWHFGPTFGVGVNYNFTEHLMGELVGNYIAGFGESQLSPEETFFPFLYSVTIHLAYRF